MGRMMRNAVRLGMGDSVKGADLRKAVSICSCPMSLQEIDPITCLDSSFKLF